MFSTVVVGILLTLVFPGQTSALDFGQGVNFVQCYNKLITMNQTDFNNVTLYQQWVKSKMFYYDPRQLIMTLPGCQSICGSGYDLWPAKDTLERLSIWVLPAIIVLTHFPFPPLKWTNTMAVIFHSVGDPLDSIWSLLIRLETQKKLRIKARGLGFENERDYRYISAIWAAYQEIGWQDVSGHFLRSVELRGGRFPTRQEMYFIMLAGFELCSNRVDSMLMAWVAIITLMFGQVAATIRTVEQTEIKNTRLFNETAHTIAAVNLLFVFIPLVKFGANLGSYSTTTIAVQVLEKLQRNLRACRKDESLKQQQGRTEVELFPALHLDPETDWDKSATTDVLELDERGGFLEDSNNASSNIAHWPDMGAYYGMNSTWCPQKEIKGGGKPWHTWLLLGYAVLFAAAGSCVPAILLSATNRAGRVSAQIGCRSMSWVAIFASWVLSVVLDYVLRRFIRKAKKLWVYTIVKDCCHTFFVVAVILVQQAGVYNSCWCRSNALSQHSRAMVNILPYGNVEWKYARLLWSLIPTLAFLLTVGFTFFIEFREGHIRGPLCKTQEKLQEHLILLEKAREEQWPLGRSNSGSERDSKGPGGAVTEKELLE